MMHDNTKQDAWSIFAYTKYLIEGRVQIYKSKILLFKLSWKKN